MYSTVFKIFASIFKGQATLYLRLRNATPTLFLVFSYQFGLSRKSFLWPSAIHPHSAGGMARGDANAMPDVAG